MKVFIIGSCFSTHSMFKEETNWSIVPCPEEADLLVLTGGADVNPAIYGHENVDSHFIPHRDAYELAIIEKWLGKKPFAGLCRGAQLLCAVNGGTLWQDCDHHVGSHMMVCKDGDTIPCSSIHHQMMRPAGNFEMLAVSEPLATYRIGDGSELRGLRDDDPEAIYWPDTNCLGVQFHPEYVNYSHPCRRKFFAWLQEYVFKGAY